MWASVSNESGSVNVLSVHLHRSKREGSWKLSWCVVPAIRGHVVPCWPDDVHVGRALRCRRLCAVMELVWVAWTCSVWSTSMLPSFSCWTRQPHLSNVSAWSSRTNLLSFPEHSETVGQISLQLKSDRRRGNSGFRPNAIPDAASARFQCAASPTLLGQVMLQRQPPASRSVDKSVAKSCYHRHFMAGGATVFCQFCHWLSHQLHVLSALSLQECVLDGFLAPLETILCHFGQARWASSAASIGASVRTSPPMRGSWWPIITSRTLAWLLSLKRSFHCIIVTQFAANCDGAAFTAWYLIHDSISRVLASLQYLRLLNIKLWHAHFYSSLDDCTDLGLSYFWRKFAVQSTSIRVHTQFQLMIWMHDLSGRFTGHSTAYKLPRWLREQRCNHPKTRTVMLTRTCDHIRLDLQQHLVHKTWVFNGLRLCLLHDSSSVGVSGACWCDDQCACLVCVQLICLASCCGVAIAHLGHCRRGCRTFIKNRWLWCWWIACFKSLSGNRGRWSSILKILTLSVMLQRDGHFSPVASVLVHGTTVLQVWVARTLGCAATEHVHQRRPWLL